MMLELLSLIVVWPPAIAFLVICFYGFRSAISKSVVADGHPNQANGMSRA